MVQAKLIYPKHNMTSHPIATEHQPGEGTDLLQYFSGKILEAFQGSYAKSHSPVPPKGKRCALGQAGGSSRAGLPCSPGTRLPGPGDVTGRS